MEATIEGLWNGGSIAHTTLSWNDGTQTGIEIINPKKFAITLVDGQYHVTAVLEDDGKLHWSDGDIWERKEEVQEVSVSLLTGAQLRVQCRQEDTFSDLQDKLQLQKPTELGTCYQIIHDMYAMKEEDVVLKHGNAFQVVVQRKAPLFEGKWVNRATIYGKKMTWIDGSGGDGSVEIEVVDERNFTCVLWGDTYIAELKDDDKLHWNDNDVWLRDRKVKISVDLQKDSPSDDCLGVEVVDKGLKITSLKGIAIAYNSTVRGKRQIKEGDYVIQINGSSVAMQDVLLSCDRLALTIERDKDQEPAAVSLGGEVEAISELVVNDTDYYTHGDKGQVTKETYVTASDGINRFEVTWYRTGLTSTMQDSVWRNNFNWVGEGVKVPSLGDEIEAFPGVCRVIDGIDYYSEGHRGIVTRDVYDAHDNVRRFEVTWKLSGLTSCLEEDNWLMGFRVIEKGEQEMAKDSRTTKDWISQVPRCRKGHIFDPARACLSDEERLCGDCSLLAATISQASLCRSAEASVPMVPDVPAFGDEVEVLPRAIPNMFFVPGDRGRVSQASSVSPEDGAKRFEVTWYRTVQMSSMREDLWRENFRWLGNACGVPVLGEELEALPGISLIVNGTTYYEAGDIGRVSENVIVTPGDGIERFEVTWYKSGLTSTMKVEAWMQHFRWHAGCVISPFVGDEVEALPGYTFNMHGKLYFVAGDRGRVSKYDCSPNFEVTWYRTGLTSPVEKQGWIKRLRWIRRIKNTLSIGDVIEALPDVETSISDGKQYYKAGDRGKVTKESEITGPLGREMMVEVTWYRTERKSIVKVEDEDWLRKFRLIESKEAENTFETWRVTEYFAIARVRNGPDYDQTILSTKSAGTLVNGYKVEGRDWVKLADEPGFIAINDISGQPLLRSQAEEWRVVTHAYRHNIRKDATKNSEVVTTVAPGEHIYGTQEGDWLRLSDGSGYSLILENSVRFLTPSLEQPQKPLWQQQPSIGSWLMRPPRKEEDEQQHELLQSIGLVEKEDQAANCFFIGRYFTCCFSRAQQIS